MNYIVYKCFKSGKKHKHPYQRCDNTTLDEVNAKMKQLLGDRKFEVITEDSVEVVEEVKPVG
jgi:predicted nucleotide-binding protein (sugar kinase/HSP70/actin superfamily)